MAAMGLMRSGNPASDVRPRGDPLMRLWDMLERAAPPSARQLAGFEAASRRWSTSTALLILVMLVFTVLAGR
jgi:hypothetical protein